MNTNTNGRKSLTAELLETIERLESELRAERAVLDECREAMHIYSGLIDSGKMKEVPGAQLYVYALKNAESITAVALPDAAPVIEKAKHRLEALAKAAEARAKKRAESNAAQPTKKKQVVTVSAPAEERVDIRPGQKAVFVDENGLAYFEALLDEPQYSKNPELFIHQLSAAPFSTLAAFPISKDCLQLGIILPKQ